MAIDPNRLRLAGLPQEIIRLLVELQNKTFNVSSMASTVKKHLIFAETHAKASAASRNEARGILGQIESLLQTILDTASGVEAASEAIRSAPYTYPSLTSLLASGESILPGSVVVTRSEGFTYEVVSGPGQAHLSTSGGVSLRVAHNSSVSIRAYGAVGDGASDDTPHISKAVKDARSRGMILNGEGLVYRITSQLKEIAGRVEGLTIDATAVTAPAAWEMVGAALDPAIPLTADAFQGGRQISVAAHNYAVGDVVLLRSDMLLETATNSVCAHWAEVVAVSAGTITLSHALLCNILMGNNARVQRLPRTDGVSLGGVRVIGSTSCPGGIQLSWLTEPVVDEATTEGCEIRGVSLVNCFVPRTGVVRGERCDRTGLGYALNISGCGWAEIGDTIGKRCRHVIAWGAANSVPCTGGSYASVIGAECTGSVFDTHPGAIGIWQRGGIVLGDMSPSASGQDAITMQAAGGSCRAKITGIGFRHVALVQTFHVAAAFSIFPSVELDVDGDTDGGQVASVDLVGTMGLRSIDVRARGTSSAEGVMVKVSDNSQIGRLTIDGSLSGGARALLVNQYARGQIGTLSISGRLRTRNTGVVAAQVLGPTDAAAPRTNVVVAGLDAGGGTYGLRVDNRADAKGLAAAFLAGSVNQTFTSGGATIN